MIFAKIANVTSEHEATLMRTNCLALNSFSEMRIEKEINYTHSTLLISDDILLIHT